LPVRITFDLRADVNAAVPEIAILRGGAAQGRVRLATRIAGLTRAQTAVQVAEATHGGIARAFSFGKIAGTERTVRSLRTLAALASLANESVALAELARGVGRTRPKSVAFADLESAVAERAIQIVNAA
jgi:hypothetical protein